jgi:hypothetical protein
LNSGFGECPSSFAAHVINAMHSRAVYLNEHAKSAHVFPRTDEEKESGIQ